jgi:hypothetical protein
VSEEDRKVSVKMSWQGSTERLECRWSEVANRPQYDLSWIQDDSTDVHTKNVSPSIPDFTRLSPFGGKWYAPDRLR